MIRPQLFMRMLCWFVLISCSDDSDPFNPPTNPQFADTPDQIELITSDIDLFWQIYDAASGTYTNDNFTDNYFRAGSVELSLFFDLKIEDPDRLTSKLSNSNYRDYYNSVRENTEMVSSNLEDIRNALDAFEHNYEAAVYSDLAFVIGAMSTGGTVVSNGSMVIGVELFTRNPDSPTSGLSPWVEVVTREASYLPSIVIHELVHVQQRNFAIKENLSAQGTLLEVALAEGLADFVTDLLIGINFNDHLPAYADPLEEELWLEFQGEMNGTSLSNWLFNAANSNDRPADLGYYIGYKIAEHFYDQQADKTAALKDILEIRNAAEFLERSDYHNKFN